MSNPVILLSIPGLREEDLSRMPNLGELTSGGEMAELTPSFPCVTCPVQANMTTGKRANEHGVVANGFYWRDERRVEMWTSPNDCIERPQLWEVLGDDPAGLRSAAWFPLHSKKSKAEYVCTPAPIHNPDGSESLWCYTRPTELYGTLRDQFGHFPLMRYWGPMAGIESTAWIVDSAIYSAGQHQPDFFYIYAQHLDYAAQRSGPDSPAALEAVAELDEQIGRLAAGFTEAYDGKPTWLAAGEYVITPVDHVTYPNRLLREAGLLEVREEEDGEHLDLAKSRVWALVDHQLAHVFVADADSQVIAKVADLFANQEGIAEVLVGEQLASYGLNHPRSGEVVLVSTPDSWQAYYWWLSDDRAPGYARTVDIHRKPGYDPVELYIDPPTKSIPLDATLVKGSHGAPARDPSGRTVLLSSRPGILPGSSATDTDVFQTVLRAFGMSATPKG